MEKEDPNKSIWEKAGLTREVYAALPWKEKRKILIRHRGMDILTCCDLKKLKEADRLIKKFSIGHMINAYGKYLAEKENIKRNYTHAVFEKEN